jgi:hypothetical protein
MLCLKKTNHDDCLADTSLVAVITLIGNSDNWLPSVYTPNKLVTPEEVLLFMNILRGATVQCLP